MLRPNTLVNNRYLIVLKIGQGGMGAVYEAIDQRLGNRVALKQTTMIGSEYDKAFEREAKILAGLRHPAFPVVSDYFTDEQGQFLVMQFIPGQNLDELLTQRGTPFLEEQVLDWADQVLRALEYLHRQQPPILHRDIKPANMKLTADNEIVLLDFGLAKGAKGLQTHVGEQTSVFGYTPHYAPLEQIQGTGTSVTSDLYALAATLYHLLTGLLPIDAPTRAIAILAHQSDPLRPAHEVFSSVSEAVSLVLTPALALASKDRFEDAAAMRSALNAARAKEFKATILNQGSTAQSAGETIIHSEPTRELETLYDQAMAHRAQEQWEQAATIWQQIVAEQPDFRDASKKLAEATLHIQKAHDHYIEGRNAFRAMSWPKAIKHLEAVVRFAGPYRDAEDLLRSARQQHMLAKLYRDARWQRLRGNWQAALDALEVIAGIDTGYRGTALLLRRTRQKLADRQAAEARRSTAQQSQYLLAGATKPPLSRRFKIWFAILFYGVLVIAFLISLITQPQLTPEQQAATAVAQQAAAMIAARRDATSAAQQQITPTAQAIQEATATTQAIQNATATVLAAQNKLLEIKKSKPIMNDSFSNNNNRWYEGESSDGRASRYIRDGVFVFKLKEKNIYWGETWEKAKLHNFIAELDIMPRTFQSYGRIMFGYEDSNNFYTVDLLTDGYYDLKRKRGGKWNVIQDQKNNEAIRKDLETNTLTIIKQENNISIYINNVFVDELSVDGIPDGEVGIAAGAYDIDNAEVHLDNFRLWKLP